MENSPHSLSSEAGADAKESVETPLSVHPRQDMPAWKWLVICVALYLGALLYGMLLLHTLPNLPAKPAKGLDTTVAADVQAQVYEDLGHIENLQWIGLGFPMASAATILTFTRGYGLFNVKVLVISSFSVFEIGSALCGAAPTSNALIVGRVVAGIGGAGMYLG
jgi:MFS family permease